MTKELSVIIEKDDAGFYIASVPALKGCHTQAKSLDELMTRIKEATELYLETEEVKLNSNFIGIQKLTVEYDKAS